MNEMIEMTEMTVAELGEAERLGIEELDRSWRNNYRYDANWPSMVFSTRGAFGEAADNEFCGKVKNVNRFDMPLQSAYGELVEGGTIINLVPAHNRDKRATILGIWDGPILKEGMPHRTVKFWADGEPKCWDEEKKSVIEGEPDDTNIGGYYVSMDLYCEFWKALGAEVGRRVGDNIYWDHGEISKIPTFYNRYEDEVRYGASN